MLRRNLPNSVTLINLAFGCLGIQQLLAGNPAMAPMFILLAAVCDFLDGMLARLLRAGSAVGKDLDSLADAVSFGVLPGLIAYDLIGNALSYNSNVDPEALFFQALPFVFLIIPVFSVIRLARFNHDTRQSEVFIGLPTPANGLFWAGLATGIHNGTYAMLNHPLFLSILVIINSTLMVSELRMFSFKFKSFAWQGNALRYVFLGLIIPVLWLTGIAGLALAVLLFIVFSLPGNLKNTEG